MNVPFLQRYRNGEFLQYTKDVIQLLSAYDIEALAITTPYNAFVPQIAAIDATFKQTQGSNITETLITLDNQRDKTLTGLRLIISGNQYYYQSDTANAAQLLLKNLSNYGANIQRLNYQEQTAVINSIITDWETKPELANAVDTLQVNNWVTYLKTTNANFSAKYLERVGEQAASVTEKIPELRAAATKGYRQLMDHLQAHATLNTTPQHALLLEQISVLAGKYNQVVENRSTTTEEEGTGIDDAPDSDMINALQTP